MKRTTIAAAALLSVALSAPLWAQAKPPVPKLKKDRVITASGQEVEGEIKVDTYKQVIVDTGGGQSRTIAGDDVLEVEYRDAPEVFLGAVERIKENDFGSGLAGLNNAKEAVDELKKANKGPRPWFDQYFSYWRAFCFAKVGGKEDNAMREAESFIAKHPTSRFIRSAVSLAFEVLRKGGNADAAEAFAAKCGGIPAELQPEVKLELAELLLAVGKFDKALEIANSLAGDPRLANRALVIKIKVLQKKGDAAELNNACTTIMQSSADPAALFIAKSALGRTRFEQKQHYQAIQLLSEALVKHYSKELAGEREDALFTLARAYEEYGNSLKSTEGKWRFAVMANRAYNELSLLFRNGKYRGEAEQKADDLEKVINKLDKEMKGPKEGDKK